MDNGSTVTVRGEYQYNGLGQRVVKRSDHNPLDSNHGLDEQRLLYYSAGWQIVEEHIDDGWDPQVFPGSTDRIVQHVWGLRYIDDLVLTRQDGNANGSYTEKFDTTHYALTDHQFSVVAIIDQTNALVHRVAYTPYGEARHQWYNDVNGDGEVNAADNTAASNASGNAIYEGGYNVDADFDRDGDVDSNDVALTGSTYYKAALPGGWIGADGSAHVIGYCGYVFNQESGLYTVRFRHYDPVWGRWISRDPAGYMDSMSLYGYVGSNPINWLDPFGLEKKGFFRGIWDYITGQEDEEWEEMMRKNQEMLKDRIEDQVERGIRSREDADAFIHEMEEMLRLTMEELDAILRDARITVAVQVGITLIPGGVLLRAVHLATKGRLAIGVVRIGYKNGSYLYRIGKGPWMLGNPGQVVVQPIIQPVIRTRIPIPVLSTPSVPGIGAPAGYNCLTSACRAICRGW